MSLRYCTLPNRPRGPSDLFFLSQRCLQASRRGGGTKGGNKIKELERDSGAEAKGATLIFFSFFLDIQVCIEGCTSDEWIAMGGDGGRIMSDRGIIDCQIYNNSAT